MSVIYQFFSTGSNHWIGLYEEEEGKWKWSDGEPHGTTTFFGSVDHSSNSTDVKDCVAIDSYSGTWIKQNCEIAWEFVCEIPKGLYQQGQTVTPVVVPQPNCNYQCCIK